MVALFIVYFGLIRMFVDSHCHLDFPELMQNIAPILERMSQHKVSHALCISVCLPDYPRVLALAEAYPNLYASVGVHPDYQDTLEPSVEGLIESAQHPKVVGIGETGLDYFRIGEASISSMEWQRQRFRTHIRAAIATGKPLIVHTRSAAKDTLRILAEENAEQVGGVMHCFTESWEFAQAAMAMNFLISFSGIVTFKNAHDLQSVAQQVPLDRILIETDSPYLAPVPFRGKTNEPSYVIEVARKIADLRGCSIEEIAQASSQNFFRLFKIPAPGSISLPH